SSYRIFPTSGDVHAMAAGRLARDSAVSVVVSHPDRQTLELLAADERGNLVSRAIFRVPNHPLGVAIADFDRDGCADVVAGGYDPNGLVLLHGRLEGGFDPPTLVAAAESVDGIAVADLDADGFADLLGWSGIGGNAFLNDRSGGFRPPVPFSGSGPAVGRLDPDPLPDHVFGAQDSVTVRYGLGDGTFGNERSYHAG